MFTETTLLILGAIVIFLLAGVAVVLWYKVYKKAKKQRVLELQKDLAIEEQRKHINTSIQILAQASQTDGLTLTEASIRISVLLDSLGVNDEVRKDFFAFYQLRELTEHIPILEGWKKLDRKQQKQFEIQRLQYEQTYRDFVLDAAARIKGREF
jgi:hypothetical protein